MTVSSARLPIGSNNRVEEGVGTTEYVSGRANPSWQRKGQRAKGERERRCDGGARWLDTASEATSDSRLPSRLSLELRPRKLMIE